MTWITSLLTQYPQMSIHSRIISNRRDAFSLVELVIVMTIAAIATTFVAMNWSGVLSSSKLTQMVETIVEADRQTRRHAVTQNRSCSMNFESSSSSIAVSRWQNGIEYFRTIHLNSNFRVSLIDRNYQEIIIDQNGSSASYLVEIANQSNQAIRWILIAGGSGQHHLFKSEENATQLWEHVRSTGNNAR